METSIKFDKKKSMKFEKIAFIWGRNDEHSSIFYKSCTSVAIIDSFLITIYRDGRGPENKIKN